MDKIMAKFSKKVGVPIQTFSKSGGAMAPTAPTPTRALHTPGLSKKVYNFGISQGDQKLPIKVQTKSPFY